MRAPAPGRNRRRHRQQQPARDRSSIHFHAEQHGENAGPDCNPCLEKRPVTPPPFLLRQERRRGQNGIVSRAANRIHERLRLGPIGMKDHMRPVRHQVHASLIHARGRAQRLFHVVLAGGANHADHGQRDRFCPHRVQFGRTHSAPLNLVRIRPAGILPRLIHRSLGISLVTGFSQRLDCLVRCFGIGRLKPRRADANLFYRDAAGSASAWLARRTQLPQCIPSIRSVTSAMIHTPFN